MANLYNRAGVNCTTTGTGTVTLGAALANTDAINQCSWQTFATAGAADGDVVPYLILDANGAWEYGTGTYTASGTTLSRTLGQSSTGSLLNLSASSQVFLTLRKEDVPKLADQQVFNGSGTWTKPKGFSAKACALIQGIGGGGGAGRGLANAAGGGGGGAYKERYILLSSLGATETVTVGAAGVGRTGSTGTGTAGGNTTLGSWLTAYGGNGGTGTAGAGSGGGPHAQGGYGGYTNASSGLVYDSIAYEGGVGGIAAGNVPGNSVYGGGGGGGSTANNGTSQYGGNGGSGSATTTATAGVAPGGGGGGNGTLNTDGKNGAVGQLTVTVFDGV